ncbi:hypothetical protein TYRP_006431 [Tyrophagus putrescentiae]|nr:hypothetical protein TYRP_006431 [Tyrophagus putrescentiae]
MKSFTRASLEPGSPRRMPLISRWLASSTPSKTTLRLFWTTALIFARQTSRPASGAFERTQAP